jgi:hypothetical protein
MQNLTTNKHSVAALAAGPEGSARFTSYALHTERLHASLQVLVSKVCPTTEGTPDQSHC